MSMFVLFVCSQGKLRSRTAELLCLFGGVYARACGTDPDAEAVVTDPLLRQADLVVCMEPHHKQALASFQHYMKAPTVTLGIPDHYDRLDPMLIRSLIFQMRVHDRSVAEAMARGNTLLNSLAGYHSTLGSATPQPAHNPAFSVFPM